MEIVHTTEFETPFGLMLCGSTERGLAYVRLPRASGRGLSGWLQRFAPGASLRSAYAPNREAIQQILQYLEGKRRAFDLPLDVRGTEFQARVYEALRAIPYGQTETYGEVAQRIGQANAVRAVGAANGANPLPLVVPCHRVVASGGKLGGYGGGRALKTQLLAMERARPLVGELL